MNDLKFAVRQLRKNPGFTAVAVITLALGIGASATVFSLVQGVLLTSPPYSRPDRLVLIEPTRADGQDYRGGWPSAQWQEWQEESKSLEAIAGYGWIFDFLVLPDGSDSIEGLRVTADYFKAVGIRPTLGRPFSYSDPPTGPFTEIILGHGLWRRHFDGDSDVIGRSVRIGRQSQPLTVVGVMPPDVRFLPSPRNSQEPNYDIDAKVDYWLPARAGSDSAKRPFWDVIGRLRPGATMAEGQAELAAMTLRQARNESDFEGIAPRFQLLEAFLNREGHRLLTPVAAAVLLVFLIACGNAAGLLLSRGLQRKHEYAVRSALGAGPLQLCRPVLMESLFLSLLGGAAGIILATACVNTLKVIGGEGIPRMDAVRLGWPVFLFSLVAAVVAGVFAGWLPALRSVDRRQANELKGRSRAAGVGRAERNWLGGVAAAQIALTLALLVGAGLLIQTARSLSRVRPGYDTRNVLTMSVTAFGGDRLDFHRRAVERVERLPGVASAAFGWGLPLTGNKWNAVFEIDGQPSDGALRDGISLPIRSVTPDYFRTLGLTLAEGRSFRDGDSEGAPTVAIVNQALVDRYFPEGTAIGRRLRIPGNATNSFEIVGVLADARTEALTEAALPELYVSFWQEIAFSKHLVVRADADPLSLAARVKEELRAIDPTAAVENVKTLEQIRADSVASRTFTMRLLVGFAAAACLLAAVGVYGVVSLTMGSQRTEIAIRMAVGAQRSDILRLVLGGGFRLAAVGVGAGLIFAFALAASLRTVLFGVGPADPLTLAGMIGMVLLIIAAACWIPALRATQVEPVETLRAE